MLGQVIRDHRPPRPSQGRQASQTCRSTASPGRDRSQMTTQQQLDPGTRSTGSGRGLPQWESLMTGPLAGL